MSGFVRAVLAWVLAFAIPVQGMAASAMLSCGPSHSRMIQGLTGSGQGSEPAPTAHRVQPTHAAHAAHAAHATHDAHAGHRHTDGSEGSDGAQQASPRADTDQRAGSDLGESSLAARDARLTAQPSPPQGDFSCSACAACCSLLALPAEFSLPDSRDLAHPMRATAPHPVASDQADTLDRPPRSAST